MIPIRQLVMCDALWLQVVQQHRGSAIMGQASSKSLVGVFVGVSTPDYADLGKAHSAIGVYTATGSAVSVAAGRLSYFFGFSGPSVSGECNSSGNICLLDILTGKHSILLAKAGHYVHSESMLSIVHRISIIHRSTITPVADAPVR